MTSTHVDRVVREILPQSFLYFNRDRVYTNAIYVFEDIK